ncbi:MAG: drug/metabolite transporter (DMT)-like permease [Bradymonadia bacterium]|jgi:drug/metabolite transporter (DMT)-like permease
MRKDDSRAGFVLMLGAVLFFSAMAILVKTGGQTLPPVQLVFARVAVTLVLSITHLRLRRISILGVNRRLLAFRGIAGTIGLACYYYALTELPLGDATAIQYTNPVWTSLIAAALLGEGIHRRDVIGGLLGVSGVALVAQPSFIFGGVPPPPAALAAICAASLISAIAYVAVRQLRRTDEPLVVVAWFPLVAFPFVAPLAYKYWVPPTPREWLVLLGIGVTTQLAQIMLTESIHRMPAGRATSIGYLQIVVAFIMGLAFFGEVPTKWSVAGACLIVSGTALTAHGAWSASKDRK